LISCRQRTSGRSRRHSALTSEARARMPLTLQVMTRTKGSVPGGAGGGASAALLLVGAHQRALRKDVTVHRLLQLVLGGRGEGAELGVQRVELEEVAVAADRRARSAPRRLLPVVLAHPRAGRQAGLAGVLGQAGGAGRDVVEHPVNPG